MRNFVKKYMFRINAQLFLQNRFRIDTKYLQNSHFLQKHETLAQQTLLFRGNPT